jgi:hypothetical protein
MGKKKGGFPGAQGTQRKAAIKFENSLPYSHEPFGSRGKT